MVKLSDLVKILPEDKFAWAIREDKDDADILVPSSLKMNHFEVTRLEWMPEDKEFHMWVREIPRNLNQWLKEK